MTPDELAKYQRLLLALQRDLLEKGPHRIDPNRGSDVIDPGSEEDEQPLNEMLQAIASNRNRSAEVVLRRVNRALDKLRKSPDDFGLCEECDEELPDGRLHAMPYTELCVDCQHRRDRKATASPTRRSLFDFQ